MKFDGFSRNEWFNSVEDIEAYFARSENFQRLLRREFEKLSILFCIIAQRDFKLEFDAVFRRILRREIGDSDEDGWECANLTIARYPSLREIPDGREFRITPTVAEYFKL